MDLSAITVADGATTPVNRTLTRTSRTGQVVKFRNIATDQIGAQAALNITAVAPGTGSAANARIALDLTLPVTAVNANGVTVVARFARFEGTIRFHADSTLEERKAFAGLVKNLLAHSDVRTIIKNVEPAG